MRQLKFRAWDGKQMQTDFNLFSEGGAFSIDGNEELFRHENWIVMQFTGLKDKNGVEMYEGDIVKTHFDKTDRYEAYDEIGIVESHWNSFQPTVIANKKHGNNHRPHSHSEVIGNIYEHPHLIEKEAVK